ELPAWKMNTALGLPWAFRVTVPVRPIVVALLYTPGNRVSPPRSGGTASAGVRPAASLYAVVRSACACAATASAEWMVPLLTTPGGKPVTAVPGLTPRSPEIIEGPVFVIVVPASTANEVAVPNPTGACTDAAKAAGAPAIPATSPMAVMVPTASTARTPRRGLPPRVTRVTDITKSPDQRNIPERPAGSRVMGCAREANRSSSPATSAVQCGDAEAGFLTHPGRERPLAGERNRNRAAKPRDIRP